MCVDKKLIHAYQNLDYFGCFFNNPYYLHNSKTVYIIIISDNALTNAAKDKVFICS